ncbi:MAG: hypothetical protein AB2L22_11425 [Syntrophales bacterium]
MTPMQSWLRSINVLNMLLLTAVAGMLFLTIQSFSHPQIVPVTPDKKEALAESLIELDEYQAPSMPDYLIIGEQNVFHPQRIIPVENKMEAVPRPEIVLYGTTITSDTAFAYIEDKKNPHSSTGRGKRQKVVKIGDSIGGFVMKRITEDMIQLTRGEEAIIVFLQDKKERNIKDMTLINSPNKATPGSLAPQRAIPSIPRSLPPAIVPLKR